MAHESCVISTPGRPHGGLMVSAQGGAYACTAPDAAVDADAPQTCPNRLLATADGVLCLFTLLLCVCWHKVAADCPHATMTGAPAAVVPRNGPSRRNGVAERLNTASGRQISKPHAQNGRSTCPRQGCDTCRTDRAARLQLLIWVLSHASRPSCHEYGAL